MTQAACLPESPVAISWLTHRVTPQTSWVFWNLRQMFDIFFLFSFHHAPNSRWHMVPLWSCHVSCFNLTSLEPPSPGNFKVLLCFYHNRSYRVAKRYKYIWLQLDVFLTGKDVNPESNGPVRVIKDGLFLSISPVTSANQGEYVCLVKDGKADIITSFNIIVSGEIHTLFILSRNRYILGRF